MQTIFADTALLPSGWAEAVRVAVGGEGRISSVDTGTSALAADVKVPVLLPALSNLHSHTFQRAMAGLSERRGPSGRDSFWTWREIMYRFLDLLSPEDVETIAALAFMEMQEAGFSAVAEFHYLHHQPGGTHYADPAELSARIVAAADQTRIGLTLLPVLYSRGGVDGRQLAGGQMRFGNDLDGFFRLAEAAEALLAAPDARLGLAPHSLRAVAPDDLAQIAAAAGSRPLHMHIAEQEQEVADVVAAYGARPVEWLLDHAQVGSNWCLIHSTHMTDAESRMLARSGAVAGLCPLTEASLGDGIFSAPAFLQAGGGFGIGTDSNILISVPGELRQLEISQRLRDRSRVVIADEARSNGRMLYDTALAGGAQALGRDCGAIRVGAWADLVALDPGRASLFGLAGDRILDGWIFAANASCVSGLWSAGRHMVRDARHVAREQIVARYEKCLARLAGRL